MKVGFYCPRCRDEVLVLDLTKDHQHVRCECCGALYCAVCQEAVASSVNEYEELQRAYEGWW